MVKLLAFTSSTRTGSHNRALIELGAAHARDHGAKVDLADFVQLTRAIAHRVQEPGLPDTDS